MTVEQLNTQTNQVKTLMNSSGENLSIGTKVGDARTYQIVPDGKTITEKGAFYDMADFDCQPPVPQQVNETGKAKWVDFTGNEECRRNYQLYTAPTTIGFDKDNNMYYFRFTVPGFNGGDSPVRFFKMYSKK